MLYVRKHQHRDDCVRKQSSNPVDTVRAYLQASRKHPIMDFNAMNLGIYVEVLYARIYNETIFFKTKPHFRNTLTSQVGHSCSLDMLLLHSLHYSLVVFHVAFDNVYSVITTLNVTHHVAKKSPSSGHFRISLLHLINMVENANVYVSGIFINSPGRNDDRRGYAGVAISCPVYGNFTNVNSEEPLQLSIWSPQQGPKCDL